LTFRFFTFIKKADIKGDVRALFAPASLFYFKAAFRHCRLAAKDGKK
jgi:hypothetical protein